VRHTGGKADREARTLAQLRWFALILLFVLTCGSVANVWYTLSTQNALPANVDPPTAAASADTWDPQYDSLEPHKALPTWLSYLVAFGFGMAVPVLSILALSVSYLRWKSSAIRTASIKGRARKWSDKLGKQTLQGEVIAIDGDPAEALLVEIDQRYDGDDSRAGTWRETSRRQVLRPFTIALPRGQHVRVEPDDRAQLAIPLGETIGLEKWVRRRRARLTLGESVSVVGRVERWVDTSSGYGGAAEGRVMRAPRRGRMLVATGALHRSATRRARAARSWLLVWSICFFLPCWFGSFPFWVNVLYGNPGVATIVRKSRITVKQRKKADYQTDVVRLRIDATNQEFSDWLRPSTGSPPVGARVPVFHAPDWLVYARVGKTPTADLKKGEDGRPYFSVVFTILLMIAYGIGRHFRHRPWWERKRVDEDMVDSTKGE
jgi:hypothetical protein